MLRLLLLLAMLFAAPAAAQRQNAIQPEIVAETRGMPGGEVELAILMHTTPGWHGYWLNPGDAGLPMEIEWQLPSGARVAPLRYPVPSRLTVAGLMNFVYEQDFAILTRLSLPAGFRGAARIRAKARWLACTDKVCVPEQGEFSLDLPTSGSGARDPRFDAWRRALPRPLSSPAKFEITPAAINLAIPLPASLEIGEPYVFPAVDGPIDYAGRQRFRRTGDMLVAELPRRSGDPVRLDGVLALGDDRGLEFRAFPGPVPEGGKVIGDKGADAILIAALGALVGGLLLNLMPCVFPILALKALHLAKGRGDPGEVRRDSLAYTAGAVLGTGALGGLLLALRAAGTQLGWAFQLQDPRIILLLMLLAVAITLNLLGAYRLPVIGGGVRPTGSFATGALAAFVATPCAGPFLGAALGTALLLPPAGAFAVFAALGLGLALPMLLIAFVPGVRSRLPKPGLWMVRLQRFLAIPMAATAVATLWLLHRQAGPTGLVIGLSAAGALVLLLLALNQVQKRGLRTGATVPVLALLIAGTAVALSPPAVQRPAAVPGAEAWTPAKMASHVARGDKLFVYFTADWCLTCKANEAAAIERSEVRAAFRKAGVKVLVGDWTNGDPAITRFLESRGRAGVPLYLWYEPKRPVEELPQVLTPGMLIARARQPRR